MGLVQESSGVRTVACTGHQQPEGGKGQIWDQS